jgi:RNA polymerase sigma factor (sigma-70 family)
MYNADLLDRLYHEACHGREADPSEATAVSGADRYVGGHAIKAMRGDQQMVAESKPAAFSQQPLLSRYLPLAQGIALRLKRRYPWVEFDDLSGYAALGLAQAARTYEPWRGVSFTQFAVQKAMFLAIDQMRKDRVLYRASAQGRPRTLPAAGAPQDNDLHPSRDVADTHSGQGIQSLVTHDLVGRLLKGLPEPDRQLIQMYYTDEMTFSEIGQVLGACESAICLRHGKLMARLRRTAKAYA